MRQLTAKPRYRYDLALKRLVPAYISKGDMAVLLAITREMEPRGWCDPSVEELAHKTGLSERQVIRATHRLRARRLIHFDDCKGGSQVRNIYRLR